MGVVFLRCAAGLAAVPTMAGRTVYLCRHSHRLLLFALTGVALFQAHLLRRAYRLATIRCKIIFTGFKTGPGLAGFVLIWAMNG
jgi:hypothetical protein